VSTHELLPRDRGAHILILYKHLKKQKWNITTHTLWLGGC